MENPLELCADLKVIFRRQSAAWLDRETLRRVRQLCTRVAAAADDPQVSIEVARIAHYAGQLYSHRDARTDSLREQVLIALDSIEDHLYGDGSYFIPPREHTSSAVA